VEFDRSEDPERRTEMKKALITGITGQDGSYLAELLLSQGYRVTGMVRRASTETFDRIAHFKDQVVLRQADLLDQFSLVKLLDEVQPDEIYNLAAMSFVPTSWNQPVLTGEFTALGVTKLLEAMRMVCPKAHFYQASPRKCSARCSRPRRPRRRPSIPEPLRRRQGLRTFHHRQLRESYNLFALSGILFNHESPRRGKEFVTRKISDAVARIKLGTLKELRMGNLDAKRDWGFAGDYVRAMWMMLQQAQADDYVVAPGRTHSVRDFLQIAFSHVGLIRGLRRHRSGIHPSRRSRAPARQSRQGPGPARLETPGQLRTARHHDGRCRHGPPDGQNRDRLRKIAEVRGQRSG
jgi:GDPmannose 4,6-dehydratase